MLSRENRKKLEKIYFLSSIKNIRCKKESPYLNNFQKELLKNIDEKDIDNFISMGYLEIVFNKVRREIGYLKLTSKGESIVRSHIKRKTEIKKEIEKIKNDKKYDFQRDLKFYERNFLTGNKLNRNGQKEMCKKCLAINVPCSHKKEEKVMLSFKARPPRKNASKTKWIDFLEKFAPSALVYHK